LCFTTTTKRVEGITGDLPNHMRKKKQKKFESFCLKLVKGKDTSDTAQFLIFIRRVTIV